VVERERDAGRERLLDAGVDECRTQVVAGESALVCRGHRLDALEGTLGGVDRPAVARLRVHLVDRLRPDAGEDAVAIVRLERPRLARHGQERRRLDALEEGEFVRLVLAGVDHERPRRVDDPRAEHLLVHLLDLGEDADEEQPVDAGAGRRDDVVWRALLVALRVREVRVVELGGEQAVGDLAPPRRVAHADTSSSRRSARSAGSASTSSNAVASRFAP